VVNISQDYFIANYSLSLRWKNVHIQSIFGEVMDIVEWLHFLTYHSGHAFYRLALRPPAGPMHISSLFDL